MQANLVNQNVSTSGTGDLVLTTAVTGFTTIAAVFANNDKLFYSVIDGNNREVGLGTFDAVNGEITRDKIFETIVAGVFDNTSPTAISLSGTAVVSVSPSIQALTTHMPTWKRINSIPAQNDSPYADFPAFAVMIGGIKIPYFASAPANNESIQIIIPVGHDVAENTELFMGVHWAPNDNSAGVVRWGFEYGIAGFDVAYSAATTLTYEHSVAINSSNKQLLSEFATSIVAAGPNSVIVGRLYRDTAHANDTYAGKAGLIQMSAAYQAKYIGTPGKNSAYWTWS